MSFTITWLYARSKIGPEFGGEGRRRQFNQIRCSNSFNVESDPRVIYICLLRVYGRFEKNMPAGHNAIQRRPDALAPCLRVSSGVWLHSWVAPPSTSRYITHHEEEPRSRSQCTMRTGWKMRGASFSQEQNACLCHLLD